MHTYKLAPRLTFKLKNWKEKILTYIEVHVYIYPYIHTLMYMHTPFILMHMYVYLLFIVILIFTFTVDIISKSTKQKKGIYKKRLLKLKWYQLPLMTTKIMVDNCEEAASADGSGVVSELSHQHLLPCSSSAASQLSETC